MGSDRWGGELESLLIFLISKFVIFVFKQRTRIPVKWKKYALNKITRWIHNWINSHNYIEINVRVAGYFKCHSTGSGADLIFNNYLDAGIKSCLIQF